MKQLAQLPEVEYAVVSIPEWTIDPQPAREPSEEGMLGISNGLAKSLNVLHLHKLGMADSLMSEYGMTGRFWGKSEFLGEITSKGLGYTNALAVYYQFLRGEVGNRHEVKNPYKNALRDAFLEYHVSFSTILTISNNIGGGNSHTIHPGKTVSKRGRVGEGKAEGVIYVPTETQMEAVLRYIVYSSKVLVSEKKIPIVAKQVAEIKCLIGDGEFSMYEPRKPFSVVESKDAWAGFYGSEKLWKRIDDVPMRSITRRAGVSRKTVRKYLTKTLGANICPNKLNCTLVWRRDEDGDRIADIIKSMPTVDKVRALMKLGQCPSDAHFVDAFKDNGKAAPLGREGFVSLVNSGTSEIYYAVHSMNTYNLTNSPYNPIPVEEREITPIGKEYDVMEVRNDKQIGVVRGSNVEIKEETPTKCSHVIGTTRSVTRMHLATEIHSAKSTL